MHCGSQAVGKRCLNSNDICNIIGRALVWDSMGICGRLGKKKPKGPVYLGRLRMRELGVLAHEYSG